MNRRDSKLIAETITNEQMKQMFDTAKENIKDWTVVSSINKSITIGMGWNILAKDFDIDKKYHSLAKTNMIREFGKYLPSELKPTKIKRNKSGDKPPIHSDPIF